MAEPSIRDPGTIPFEPGNSPALSTIIGRAGPEAPSFQTLYRSSFDLLPYRLDGKLLVPEKGTSDSHEPTHWRPPGMNPIEWILDSAAN